MARDLAAGLLAEVTAASLRPALFYEGVFASGTVRLWSGVGSITWNSQTWTGAGNLIGVSQITETVDARAVGIVAQLAGMSTEIVQLALAQSRQGAAGKVWIGAIDAAGAVVADPFLAFSGRLDVPSIEDGGDSATIQISYESRLVDLERPRERRYTDEDQRIDYPSDQGFAFVPYLQDAEFLWGRG